MRKPLAVNEDAAAIVAEPDKTTAALAVKELLADALAAP
jgi:hypothetical protein